MQGMANIALRAARRAGQVLLRGMDRLDELKVEEKAPNDFVSNIDREAERVIVDALLKTYPDHAILAEEGSGAGLNEDAEFTWIIDPLGRHPELPAGHSPLRRLHRGAARAALGARRHCGPGAQ